MPQNLQQKTINTFNKGLVTEFSELQFPEGASIDELNCSLSRDGTRSRRLGLEFETNNVLSSFTQDENEIFHVGEWRNAGGVNNFSLVVVQHGATLSFYAKNNAPYSGQEQPFTVDLNTFKTTAGTPETVACQFASIAGLLIVVSESINPFFISYNSDTNSITTNQISFRVRDFDWQSDISRLTEEDAASGSGSNPRGMGGVSAARKYDTYNAGWVDTAVENVLIAYTTQEGAFPPLTHPWFSGKNASDQFVVNGWKRVYSGTSIISNGHYVLDFFEKDRSAVSGIAGLSVEVEATRFKTVCSYAGRVWYAGLGSGKNAGRILYSRIVETLTDSGENTVIGECFQQNDPTAEYSSDLLATDGGVITIPDATDIKLLYTYQSFLFVFADNGIWAIGGVDEKFSPEGYFVTKVSNVGILNERSFVSAEGIPFWWSKNGIHSFTYDNTGTSRLPIEQSISIQTIQSFWNNIDNFAKSQVSSSYDQVNKRIFWIYPPNGETKLNKRTEALILDIPLQAFYPWSVSSSTVYPMALSFYDSYGSSLTESILTDDQLENITTASGNVTVLESRLLNTSDVRLVCWARTSSGQVSVALFTSKSFMDFNVLPYESFAEAGYDFGGDLMLKKNAPYIIVYCRSTEEGFTGNEVGGYEAINPSSLFVKAYWDFKTQPSSTQQAYRIKPFAMVNPSDLTDNQQDKTVQTTRLKVRGHGRSMRLRFEAEEGKNFELLGYGVILGANTSF